MNLKQKVLMMAASALPVLALFVFFVLAPTRVAASAFCCPDGSISDGDSCPDGYCSNGSSGCYAWIGDQTVFVFCPNGNGGYGGLGTCVATDCVQCQDSD